VSVKVTVGQQTFIKKIVLGTPITTARETLSIDEFTDFDVATKSDAQILVFDSSEGVFKNFTFDVGQGLAREYSPADDKLIIGIDSDKTPVVTGILSKGNLTPTLDSTFDLGDSNRKWKDLHLSGSTIHLGGIKLKDSGGDFSVKDSTGTPVNIDLGGSVQQIRGFFSSGGDLSYDSTTGRFEFDVEQVYTKSNFDSDLGAALDGGVGIAYDSATDTIRIDSAELEANFKQDIRGYFSSSNSLNYNSTTGDFRLPQPLDSAARATFQKVIIPDGGLGGDSARITFGNDSDLKIFHNGSHSVIRDAGTGSLQLQTNNLAVQNATGTENQITALSGGAVSLFFNNSNKLTTTDSGVTATGSIRGDSATIPIITADSALITDISGTNLNYASINAAVGSVDSARVTNVSGTNLNYASIHGAAATVDSARVTNVSGTNLNYASIHGAVATIDSAVITNVSGSSANFTTLHSRSTTIDSAHIDALSGDSARFNDLHADSAHITNLTAATINFNDINIDSADISILSGDSAKITNISGTSANYASINGAAATIDSARVTNISGSAANYASVNAAAATIDSAKVINISGTSANYGTLNGIYQGFDSDLARTTSRQTIRTYFNTVDAGGDGSFAYDSATGQFTYTGPSASEVRAHLSASNSLSYNSSTGDFRLPQPLDSSANPTFNQLRGPASFVIDPATIGDNTGTVRILGNLQVEGTQTIINSTTVSLNDKNIVIADSAADSSALDGGGITWGGASIVDTPTFNYSHANARLVSNREINAPLFSGSGASLTNLPAASLTGTIDSARIPTLLIADIGNINSIDHDALANFVADEHVAHSGVSITAGFGLKGGGTIASTRDLAIDSAELLTYYEPIIRHDNLSGFVANEHIDHTGVSVTAGFGLKGGGTIASTRDLAIDSAELLTYYEPILRHDNLSGFVANEHIDHTSVSVIAGNGLAGGGDISSSRTISIDSSQIKGLFSAGGDLSYNSGTGEFSFDVESVYTKENFDSDYFFAKDSANTAVERNKHDATTKSFAVTYDTKTADHVYNGQGSSLGYKVDGVFAPVLHFKLGRTYRFTMSASDMTAHPLRLYVDAAKTTQYTTNVTSTSTYTEITVTEATPSILHYQCSLHGYMGHVIEIGTNNLRHASQVIDGNGSTGGVTISDGNVDIRSGTGSVSQIKFYCEVNNAHAQTLKAQPHSAGSSAVITLPVNTGTLALTSQLFDGAFSSLSGKPTTLAGYGITDALIDSSLTTQLIDSAYIQTRVPETYLATLIDSAYVQARQLPSTDSVATQAMIDSNFTNMDIDIHMPDNQKITFGNDSDLKIFHSGSGSFIQDAGTGNLRIGGNVVSLENASFNESMLLATQNSSVELYFNGNKKFETTDSGATVSGSFRADSARISGLKLPIADGLNNHVIKTDGNGNLSFASVTALSGNIDSAAVIQLVDSSYINTRVDFDSASVTQLIDSSYVQIRVPETYLATLIDSAYVQARTTAGTDSAATISLIESTVDSAYVALREANAGGGGTTGFVNNVGTSSFVGDNATTAFTLAQTPADSDDAFVFINGLLQQTNTYSISGDTLTLDSAPDSSAEIEVRTHLLQSANLTLRDHKSFIYTLGTNTTTLSGNDSSGTSLRYDVGKVDVFVNGSRLVNGKDFTATTGTSIVFDSAFSAGNIVEVVSHAKATTADLNGIISIDSDLTTTSANQIVYTYAAANHRTLKFTAQLEHDASSSYHAEEVLLTHNGTNVAMTTYAQVLLDSNLGTFDADINSGNVRVKFTPTKTNTSIKLRAIRTLA